MGEPNLVQEVAAALSEKGRLKPGGECIRYARIAVEAVAKAKGSLPRSISLEALRQIAVAREAIKASVGLLSAGRAETAKANLEAALVEIGGGL